MADAVRQGRGVVVQLLLRLSTLRWLGGGASMNRETPLYVFGVGQSCYLHMLLLQAHKFLGPRLTIPHAGFEVGEIRNL